VFLLGNIFSRVKHRDRRYSITSDLRGGASQASFKNGVNRLLKASMLISIVGLI
jgi:hypothetical protein